MKKNLLLLTLLVTLLGSCEQKPKSLDDEKDAGTAPCKPSSDANSDDDELTVVLFFSYSDANYDSYKYTFLNNKIAGAKEIDINPVKTFISINKCKRGNNPDGSEVKYNFTIKRYDKATGKFVDELNNEQKLYHNGDFKNWHSKVVMQEVNIKFEEDLDPLTKKKKPIVINPPIKPESQP